MTGLDAPTVSERIATGASTTTPSADLRRAAEKNQLKRYERIVLRQSEHFYKGINDYLVDSHGFTSFAVSKTQRDTRRTKTALVAEQFAGAALLLRNIRKIQQARVIFAVGYIALTAKILRRLGLLRYETLYWYPFFIIKTSWYPLFRWLAKLDTDRETYVVSSEGEIPLYERKMAIPSTRLAHLPFGDWESDQVWENKSDHATPYYFSGGATNRDYAALSAAWKHLPDQRLVIVCSQKLNPEVQTIDFPPNVEIKKDIPLDEFERLVSGARACIIPFKHDTGGSGHSVFLQYMRKKKAIIVNRVHLMKEYVDNGTTGLVVDDIATQLPAAIRKLEQNASLLDSYGNAAFASYKRNFSRSTMERRVTDLIRED